MLMNIGTITLKKVEFPGRAGELQRGNATASLVAELGDNYETYHAYLNEQLAQIGKPPVAKEYPSLTAYYDAWDRVQELVKAEHLLRNCKAFRRSGRNLDAPASATGGPPLMGDGFQMPAA